MAKTLSFRNHVASLNEWLFSFSSSDRKKLTEAVESLKKVHSDRIVTLRVMPDPDSPKMWMAGGVAKKDADVSLLLQYLENQFHQEEPLDSHWGDDDIDD